MSNYELEILIGGRPINVYNHNGNYFVEGRKGSKYELKVINNSWVRIEAVLSVDGLSVTTDGPAGPANSGYVVPARSSIVIPGYRRNSDNVAEFLFSEKKHSYSAITGQGSNNVGAIGLMVFEEEIAYTYNPIGGNIINNSLRNMGSTVLNATLESTVSSSAASLSSNCNEQFSLGTTWGNEITHKVKEVSFNRADKNTPNSIITIYYDTRQALEARGIRVVSNSAKRYESVLPNPFPGFTGCTPPPGWRSK
jgi:hypothetical protein